jgi:hypothetical protein
LGGFLELLIPNPFSFLQDQLSKIAPATVYFFILTIIHEMFVSFD